MTSEAGPSSGSRAGDGQVHRLLVAGSNARGQLGLGHDEDAHIFSPALCLSAESEQPVVFPPSGHRIEALASGANHAVAITERSSDSTQRQVWASGSNAEAQLGSSISAAGTLLWTQLDPPREAALQDRPRTTTLRPTLVACGWNVSFVVLAGSDDEDDLLLCLGSSNDFGELGCGKEVAGQGPHSRLLSLSDVESTSSSRAPLRIRRLASGVRHSCALVSQSEPDHVVWQLFGWGAARRGQIGTLSESDKATKQAESVRWTPKCFATWRAPRPASGDAGEEAAVFLAAGKEHTMLAHPSSWQPVSGLPRARAPSTFLSVETWGSPAKGACDLSAYLAAQTIPQEQHAKLLGADCTWNGTFACLASPSGAVDVLSSGTNDKGQAGAGYFGDERGQPDEHASPSSSTEMRLARPDGTQWLVRRASSPRPASSDAQWKLVCGSEHVALFAAGTSHAVWAWGWNEHGNLGTGSADGQGELHDECSPREIWRPRGPGTQVQNVWAGCGTTFIQLSEPER